MKVTCRRWSPETTEPEQFNHTCHPLMDSPLPSLPAFLPSHFPSVFPPFLLPFLSLSPLSSLPPRPLSPSLLPSSLSPFPLPQIKKLVYVYLVRYAEEQQDLALLSISTFQKGLKDPNQLIRASALRVLSSIRVPIIAPIMMLAIKEVGRVCICGGGGGGGGGEEVSVLPLLPL